MAWYKDFLKRFGFAGFLLTVLAVSYVVLLILLGTLGEARFGVMWSKIGLPSTLSIAVDQPWSIFTYWLDYHPVGIWFLLTDMVVLYAFGHILNAMIGDSRLQGIFVIAVIFNGLATIGLSNLLPIVEVTDTTRLAGFGAINATLIGAAITLVPRYNFRVLVWDVPLVFIGLFVLAVSFVAHRLIFTMEGTAELVGAILGFGLIKFMRNGWDVTNWFRGASNRPPVSIPRQPEPVLSTQRPVIRTVPKQKPQPTQQPALSEAEELDDLLDKINEVGYNGLSQHEKERLDKLSGK